MLMVSPSIVQTMTKFSILSSDGRLEQRPRLTLPSFAHFLSMRSRASAGRDRSRGARAGKRMCSCLWQLKFYIGFNCLDHELFGINWPSCGGVLLDRYKLLSYAPQQCTVSPKIYFLSRDKHRMATRVIKLREAEEPAPEMVQEVLSQSKRPEVGRFLLQVDRQTKRSFATAEAAETAGMVIKKGHPIVRVSVYDSVETANKIIELPAGLPPTS